MEKATCRQGRLESLFHISLTEWGQTSRGWMYYSETTIHCF